MSVTRSTTRFRKNNTKKASKSTAPAPEDFLPVFEFHGVALTPSGTQHAGDCPFCDKEAHFYVEQSTGLWVCHTCQASGNVYTFLHKLYLQIRDSTSATRLNALARSRNLDVKAIDAAGWAYDELNNRYLLPVYNRNASLANLKAYRLNAKKRLLLNTPSPIIGHLFNSQKLANSADNVFICEGEWDAIALEYALNTIPKKNKSKILSEATILAVPGAGTGTQKLFNDRILELLAGKTITILMDNDEAGKNGTQKLAKLLASRGHTDIHTVVWPMSYPTGYDVSDHLTRTKLSPEKAWGQILEWVEPISSDIAHLGESATTVVNDLPKISPRTKFSQVLTDFRKHGVFLNKDLEGGIAIAAATALSNELPGDPLWFFLVGPSGCISGDARLKYVVRKDGKLVNKKGGRFATLFDRFHGFDSEGPRPPRTDGCEYFIPSVKDNGDVFLNKIVDVVDSGVANVFEVTVSSGRKVRATSNHPFMTENGYVELADLAPGDLVFMYDGIRKPTGVKKPRIHRKEILVKQHAKGRKKTVNGYVYYRVKEYHAVIEASKNGMKLETYIHTLNTCTPQQATNLWTVPDGMDVHHLDENPLNNSIENLALVSHKDHAGFHFDSPLPKVHQERITSIRPMGKERVYDLVVEDPYRNFVVEGFAVHNSGKSLILESTMASPNYIYRSTTNARDLISGHIGEGEENTCLIRKLIEKTFVIKDYTTVLTLPLVELQQMNGLLRDAYDGAIHRSYGHGKEVIIDGFFSILAGVTNKIHSHQNSNLGERFLKYEIAPPQGLGNRRAIVQALSGGLHSAADIQNRKYRQASFCSFVDGLRSRLAKTPKNQTLKASTLDSIISMSQFVAICRSVVERDRNGATLYDPSPEAGTRLAKQLVKLPQALCHVYGLRRPDENILRIVRKTAWDSSYSRIRSIYSLLYHETPDPENPHSGLTAAEISEALLMPKSTTKRTLDDMHELSIISRRNKNRKSDPDASGRGRPEMVYRLVKEARDIYTDCGFTEQS